MVFNTKSFVSISAKFVLLIFLLNKKKNFQEKSIKRTSSRQVEILWMVLSFKHKKTSQLMMMINDFTDSPNPQTEFVAKKTSTSFCAPTWKLPSLKWLDSRSNFLFFCQYVFSFCRVSIYVSLNIVYTSTELNYFFFFYLWASGLSTPSPTHLAYLST